MKIAVFNALHELEQELKAQSLWGAESPSPEHLASQEPFCVDTMPFEQWLQWVFIPKMTMLVGMPTFTGLAHESNIHSMAEYVFKPYPQETNTIVSVIKNIDTLLNQYK